jgi:hypothetical protein
MSPRLLTLFLLATLAACATPEKTLQHQSLRDKGAQPMPRKVLLIPPDVRVSEISAGGVVEEVPDWTRQANGHMRSTLSAIAGELKMEALAPPRLSPERQESLEQHMALYDLVAGNAFFAGRNTDPAWSHKKQAFDYSIGPGLAFLPEQAGTDAALFIIGADYISSSNRKAAMLVGALFGVAIPGGISYLTAGVVDLRSGDLLWLNYEVDQTTDLREAKDADGLLRKVFSTYPGQSVRP